jgi:hypothetical protein
MDMVERVRDAILSRVPAGYGMTSDEASEYARAAIEAMSEPTAAMVDAVFDRELDIYWSYKADGRPGGPKDVWSVMIDAALNPAESSES